MSGAAELATVAPARGLTGVVRMPGDKSISHRYALIAAIADGTSTIRNYAPGADCRTTLECLGELGVAIRKTDTGEIAIVGRGLAGLRAPSRVLDAGNSGTTIRMLTGILAGHPFEATITGDASLRRRPMGRVIRPLASMGARFTSDQERPPITVRGGQLSGLAYALPIPSAQVKSAILFAGLHASGDTSVTESAPSRDHTEIAFGAFGVRIVRQGPTVGVHGGQRPKATALTVPGDPSSAAFFAAAAAALPGSSIDIEDVGLNPTRIAYLDVLRRAGASITVTPDSAAAGGEPRGRLTVAHGVLQPFTVEPSEVPALIDELPVLAALATHGGGMKVTGAGELRVKESDRIASVVAGIRALGGSAVELEDGFIIHGGSPLEGGTADAAGDHRLAMAFAVALLGSRRGGTIEGASVVDVSFPGFFTELARLCR